jgi:hypothetical protein
MPQRDEKRDGMLAKAAARFKSTISFIAAFLVVACLTPYWIFVAVLAAFADRGDDWRND